MSKVKLQLVKETKYDGNVFYYVTMNGVYVSGSTSTTKEAAQALYERLKLVSAEPKIEVLEEYESNGPTNNS